MKTLAAEEAEPTEDIAKYAKFVKQAELRPRKHGNHSVLPFVPYSVRSFSIYISDFVEILTSQKAMRNKVSKIVDAGPDSDFAEEMRFLEYADSVLDVHACGSNAQIQEGMSGALKLGVELESNLISFKLTWLAAGVGCLVTSI